MITVMKNYTRFALKTFELRMDTDKLDLIVITFYVSTTDRVNPIFICYWTCFLNVSEITSPQKRPVHATSASPKKANPKQLDQIMGKNINKEPGEWITKYSIMLNNVKLVYMCASYLTRKILKV